jgi:hypothetical protein
VTSNLNQSPGGESVCSGRSSGFCGCPQACERPMDAESRSFAKWLIAGILAFAAAWAVVFLN